MTNAQAPFTSTREHQIHELANFIVYENYKHHSQTKREYNFEKSVDEILQEEKKFFKDSKIFTVRDNSNQIVGCIRTLNWNYYDELPMQKIFGFNPILIPKVATSNQVIHIGRFAVSKNAKDKNLFKKLMLHAIKQICEHKLNIGLAECDSKLLRIMNLLGIKAKRIGNPKMYLGSETIPIIIEYTGVIDFYHKNKHLITAD